MANEGTKHERSRTRFLARVIRCVLLNHSFTTLADLTDVVKTECAQMHVRIDPDDFSQAYRWLGFHRARNLR